MINNRRIFYYIGSLGGEDSRLEWAGWQDYLGLCT
jgi:hypothetical protein